MSERFAKRYADQIERVIYGALPRALDVACIAARQLQLAGIGSAIKPEFAAPLYLRNKVAMTIEERRAHHAAKASTV